jgi:hypothetical protein
VELGATVDCVILDYQMPDMNGGDVAKRIRESYPKTKPVIQGDADTDLKDYPSGAFDWEGYIINRFGGIEINSGGVVSPRKGLLEAEWILASSPFGGESNIPLRRAEMSHEPRSFPIGPSRSIDALVPLRPARPRNAPRPAPASPAPAPTSGHNSGPTQQSRCNCGSHTAWPRTLTPEWRLGDGACRVDGAGQECRVS